MGGVKDSGFGHRHGAEGIRKFCQQKTIVIDRFGLKEVISRGIRPVRKRRGKCATCSLALSLRLEPQTARVAGTLRKTKSLELQERFDLIRIDNVL